MVVAAGLLCLRDGLAQRVGAPKTGSLSAQTWGVEEGLPQSSVHGIAQTEDGYLWVATEAGLARFDGMSFRVFDRRSEAAFKSDDLCCVLPAAEDGLWVGSADGLLERREGRFVRYTEVNGLPSASVLSLRQAADGALLVETTAGWARGGRSGFHAVDAPEEAVVEGRDGARWSYTGSAVTVVRGGETRVWTVGRELPAGRVAAVDVDRAGRAWIATSRGLFVAGGTGRDAQSAAMLPSAAGLMPVAEVGGSSVLSVMEDAEGDHWVGTETGGLVVLRSLPFHGEPGLGGVAVTAVVESRDGAMWAGTREDGVRVRRGGVWETPVAAARMTSAVVLCMTPSARGGVWVGTPDGLNYVAASGDGSGYSVWRITLADGLPDDYIRSLAEGRDGTLWVGTPHGLAKVRGVGSSLRVETLTTREGLGGDLIGALAVPLQDGQTAVWVSTSGGLSQVREDGTVKTLTQREGLTSLIVTAMAEAGKGRLWVATADGGLGLLSGGRVVAVPRDVADGVDGGAIEAMAVDGEGSLWLRMGRGVRRVAAGWVRGCLAESQCTGVAAATTRYGRAEGMPNEELVLSAPPMVWPAADGSLWFPTRGGVAVAEVSQASAQEPAVPVVVQGVAVDGSAMMLDAPTLEVPFGHSRLTVEYAGLSYRMPGEVRYRFRLMGFDAGWTEVGGRRSATYTNLPSGRYTFVVQAAGRDGQWSEPGASVRFRVVPPFYRRAWFVAGLVVAFGLLLWGMYLLRLRVVRRRFDAVLAERNRMAREIHDTLTQDFVATTLQLDLLQQQLKAGQTEKALAQAVQTRQMVTEGLAEARRSIWELRANQSEDRLPTRLRRLVERETFAAVRPRLEVGGAYRVVQERVEREVLRIAQEALSNVVRHAAATEVLVELRYSQTELLLQVCDDGRGFVVEQSVGGDHFGLVGMRERAASIGAALEIASAVGEGSTIRLLVPLAEESR